MYKKGDFITLKSWEEITNGNSFFKSIYGFSKDIWESLKKVEHQVASVHSSYVNFELTVVYAIYDKKRNCWCYIPEKLIEAGYSLSKEEAIKRHRMMWKWMSEESIKQKRAVTKQEAIEHFGWLSTALARGCWCCEYAMQKNKDILTNEETVCPHCPLEWPNGRCTNNHNNGYYDEWFRHLRKNDFENASLMAFQISKLYENMDI